MNSARDPVRAVAVAHAEYQAARYGDVLDGLPELIVAVDQAAPEVVMWTWPPHTCSGPIGWPRCSVETPTIAGRRSARRALRSIALADALVALLAVERSAPHATSRNIVARDTIRQLLARARGATGPAVRGLASRAGVTV